MHCMDQNRIGRAPDCPTAGATAINNDVTRTGLRAQLTSPGAVVTTAIRVKSANVDATTNIAFNI